MSADLAFDAELIRRYGGSVPRYTSYPTALQFNELFAAADLHAALARCAGQAAPSLYLHVPFCASPCFYCACMRVITRQRAPVQRYAAQLCGEIALWGQRWTGARGLRQLHFGGGTPTALDDAHLTALMAALERSFGFVADAGREYSLEIDPRTVDGERLQRLAGLGFNRVSFGVQDLDADVQAAINREQPLAVTAAAIDGARAAGFRSIAVDLIYGLPRQTPASFATTLRQIVALRPDRVAVYAYAHMPGQFGAQRQIRLAELPDAATRLRLLQLASDTFVAAGYRRIGMDHFACPDDDLAEALEAGTLQRNFQGYSTHAGRALIGVGVSAISRIDDCYAQNTKDLGRYASCIAAHELPVQRGLRLDADDLLRREIIETIMCGGEIDCAAVEDRYGINFARYFSNTGSALEALVADRLIELRDGRLCVTARGRPLVRNIARVFDRYAPAAPAGRHSAAI